MRISHRGLSLIRQYEGFSAVPYWCPAGYRTIGYGHVVLPGEVWDRPLTEEEATGLLREDVRIAEQAVLRQIRYLKGQSAFDALVSFTFNLGEAALQRSRLRLAVNRRDDADTAAQWGRWVYAGGKVLGGLVARRKAELALYMGGDFT